MTIAVDLGREAIKQNKQIIIGKYHMHTLRFYISLLTKMVAWVKVKKFLNPELFKNQILKLAVCLQISIISSLNGQ